MDILVKTQVKVGNNKVYVNFSDYFVRNWESCRIMWAHCYRRNITCLMGNNTNNRIERFWRTTKNMLKSLSQGDLCIQDAVIMIRKFMDSRIVDRYNWSQRHIMQVFNEDLQIKEELYKSGLYLNDLGQILRNFTEIADGKCKIYEKM